MTSNETRVMIVDDEPYCRLNLRAAIEKTTQWQIVSEQSNAIKLKEYVDDLQPHIIFLDIAMPIINGLDAARDISKYENPPLIVFVTAFDEHALAAFEVCALDYLLKPFDLERFAASVERIADSLENKLQQTSSLRVATQQQYLSRIVIKSMSSLRVIDIESVRFLCAAGNYVEVVHSEGTHLHRSSLASFESYLDPRDFCRIHRRVIVKMSLAKELLSSEDSKYRLLLKTGEKLPVGEKFRTNFLEQWLN